MPDPTEPGETPLAPATIAIQAGRGDRQQGSALNVPPTFASAYRGGGEHGYSRDGNPTWDAFESAIGSLEGGTAVAFSSGMAAAAGILDGLEAGSKIAVARSSYIEVRRLLEARAARDAAELTSFDASDPSTFTGAMRGCSLVWVDALSNPTLEVPELEALIATAREVEATVVVDSTLATPLLLRPLELGADLVLHSATKQIGGHSDLLLGVAVTADPQLAEGLRSSRSMLGAVPGTMEAWLALRGLRTLPLRIERAQSNARLLAERLAAHPEVERVRFPGLEDDPSHDAARRLLGGGFGTLVSFELRGGISRVDAVCRSVRVLSHATSLGGVETLIDRQSWHRDAAVPDDLLRISVGCEDPEDLWADLERAIRLSANLGASAAPRSDPTRGTAPR